MRLAAMGNSSTDPGPTIVSQSMLAMERERLLEFAREVTGWSDVGVLARSGFVIMIEWAEVAVAMHNDRNETETEMVEGREAAGPVPWWESIFCQGGAEWMKVGQTGT